MVHLPSKNNDIMKKVLFLLIASLVLSSCDINTEPIELTATAVVNEAIAVSIPQTSGTTVNFNENVDQDLTEIVSNFNDVTDININSLTYQYENVTGNTNAVIQSATIVINGTTIATLSNVNINQEASNATTFEISDVATLDAIEAQFLSNSTANIQFSGSAVSEEGSVDFDIALAINLTVTF